MSRYLSFFSLSVKIILWSARTAKSIIRRVLFFWFITTISVGLAEVRWSEGISKSPRRFCVSFSRRDAGLCIYYLFVWSIFNFCHSSLWLTLPTQSFLVSHSFCAKLLFSLIKWLIVSYLFLHNLYLQFFASYLILLWYYWSLWRYFVLLLEEIQFLS